MQIEIIDTSRIIGADLSRTVLRSIYKGTPQLKDTLLGKIVARTPYYSGALQADEAGTFNTDYNSGDPELVHLYTGTENQLDAQSFDGMPRVYANAIEFGSPDNPYNPTIGHSMFGLSTTEDTQDIEEWGASGLQSAARDITSGRSLRL